MEYNKNQFVKANDHKVLHKVKKQWVVLSMSMLALLGGGVVAEHLSAHADTNNNQGQSTLKDRLNQNLSQAHQATLVQSPAKAQSAQSNTYNGRQMHNNNNGQVQSASQSITNQANVLHNRILRSANEQVVNASNEPVNNNKQANKNSNAKIMPYVPKEVGNIDSRIYNPDTINSIDSNMVNSRYYSNTNTNNKIILYDDNINAHPNASEYYVSGYHTVGSFQLQYGFKGLKTGEQIPVNLPTGYRFIDNPNIDPINNGNVHYHGQSPAIDSSATPDNSDIKFFPSSNQFLFPGAGVNKTAKENMFPILLTQGNIKINVVRHFSNGTSDTHQVDLPSGNSIVTDSSNSKILYNMSEVLPQSNIGSNVKNLNGSLTRVSGRFGEVNGYLTPIPQGDGYYGDSYTYTLPKNPNNPNDKNYWQSLDQSGLDYNKYLAGFTPSDHNSNTITGTFLLGNSTNEGDPATLSNGTLTLNYNQQPDYQPVQIKYKDMNTNDTNADSVNSAFSYVKLHKTYTDQNGDYTLDPKNETSTQIEGLSGFPQGYTTDPQNTDWSINSNGQTVIPVEPLTDTINFVLTGSNIPKHYKGPIGKLSSDNQDYYYNNKNYPYNNDGNNRSDYTFNNGDTAYNSNSGHQSTSDIRGLIPNYHISDTVDNRPVKQSIKYDGMIHRINVAPNEEKGYINYVYTDKKGNQHLVKQVTLNKSQSDSYGVQFHVNGKSGISDEKDAYNSLTNPTGLKSSDQITGRYYSDGTWKQKQYRLVNQGADANKFIFDDGTLLNGKPQGDSSEQDNPSDTTKTYNPSNNVFTVQVEPVKGSKIDIYYVNETGQQIGATKEFNGNFGDSLNKINTSGPNKGKEASDKIVSDNPDPTDYNVDLTKSDLSNIYSTYHFTSDVQDITVPLVGKNTSQNDPKNQVTVNVKRVNADGSTTTQPVTIHLNGQIGNFVTLYPSEFLNGGTFASSVPSGELDNYAVDPKYPDESHGDTNASSDWDTKPVTYYLKGNGNGSATLYTKVSDASMLDGTNGSQTKGDQIGPHYVPNSTAVQPTFTYINHTPGTIKLTYKDTSGNVVPGDLGNSDNIVPNASDYGKSINLISSDSKLSSGSKGEKVPDGYALDDINMPDTIYTINGNNQNVTLYVKKTNNQEKTTNSGSYPLVINRVEHVYVNGTHTEDKLASTATPKISNIVGGSDTLNASTYAPNDGNNIVDAASDASYQIKFNNDNPGSLTVTDYNNGKGNNVSPTSVKPNDTLTSTDGADGTKEIVFNYNDYQTVAQKHNYVHYISYSDMDNNSDITKTFNDQNFVTTLQDAGSDNQPFNNEKYYTTNVPQGFQFYKIWKVQSDNDGGQPHTNSLDVDNNPHDSGYTTNNSNFKAHQLDNPLTKFGKNDQNEYIEVIPNASQITVHYVDQNGHQLSQNTYSGSDQGQISQRGYSSKYGQFIQESDIENKVPHGYQLEVQPYHTADNSVDHNSTFMFGRQPQDVRVTVVGQSEANNPITVKYINQAGSLVGYQSFAGRLGDQVNVVGDHQQNVPQGYQLLNDNQPTKYSFENRPYTVYLNVKGQNVDHKITVERVMKQSDGTTKVDDISSDNPQGFDPSKFDIHGSDGSVTEINPETYTPSGYTPDYSKDSVQFITLNQNQKLMPNKVVFYYDDQTTNGAPIMIHYVNQVGDQVGSQILNGNVGDQTKDANDLFNSQPNLKNAYKLSTNKNTTFKFTNSPQTDVINVTGNSNSTPFDLKIITENADGSKAKVSDRKINVGSQVGDHFDISPYDTSYVPAGGFHPTESDSDISGTIEANGKLSPVNTAAFVYQNDSGQGDEGIGTVRVHYVTKSPASDGGINASTGQPNDGDEIDEESDQGYVDTDTFDTTPYLHDIPESVAQFYDLPAGEKALDQSGNAIDNDTWKFASGVKDIYVKVERTSGPIIID